LVQLYNTIDVVVYNIHLKDSPMWNLHLANTTNVHIYNVNITAPPDSHNTDGYDIDCSVNVLLENSFYDGGKKFHKLSIFSQISVKPDFLKTILKDQLSNLQSYEK
jgi:polygalacturonase